MDFRHTYFCERCNNEEQFKNLKQNLTCHECGSELKYIGLSLKKNSIMKTFENLTANDIPHIESGSNISSSELNIETNNNINRDNINDLDVNLDIYNDKSKETEEVKETEVQNDIETKKIEINFMVNKQEDTFNILKNLLDNNGSIEEINALKSINEKYFENSIKYLGKKRTKILESLLKR